MAGMASPDPVSGSPLHRVEHGAGTPVLVLHGAYSAHEETAAFLEPLFAGRPGYRRVYVDLPGMGESPADGIDSSDDAVDALERLVDERIGADPFLVVAQSYGGYLARGLVARRPGQVAGMALVCPVMEMGEMAGDHPAVVVAGDLDGMLTADQEAEYRGYFVVQTPETAQRFLDGVAPVLGRFDGPALERYLIRWRLTPPPEEGPASGAPTLVVTGRQDAVVGHAAQWGLREQFPHATFATLDLAGHALPHERPALLEALLADWLDRVALGARGSWGGS